MQRQRRNVFISHVHEDDIGLSHVRRILKANNYLIRDASIHSGKPNNATANNYIKSQILAPRIKWAGVMIVYISPKTKSSPWVNWEIEYAQKQGRRIIGIWAHGARDCDVPDALAKYADAVVGWRATRIIGAIDGKINNWHTPQGCVDDPKPIRRVICQ